MDTETELPAARPWWQKTDIEWANYTGGPYLGCSKVSPGCMNCYAWALAETRLEPIFRRAYKAAGFSDWATRPVWGDRATRVLTRGFWDEAKAVNRRAYKEGIRVRWFPSMIDWLDEMPAGIVDQDGKHLTAAGVLADFLDLVWHTPSIDWLLLTKRPELWRSRMKAVVAHLNNDPMCLADEWLMGDVPLNIWVGASTENQATADSRIPALLAIPAKVRFLSVEPMLGTVSLDEWIKPHLCCCHCGSSYDLDEKVPDAGHEHGADQCARCGAGGSMTSCWGDGAQRVWDETGIHVKTPEEYGGGIHWVIVGGESGPSARPCNVGWIRSVIAQCQAAYVPVFVKQLGANARYEHDGIRIERLRDKKGGEPSEWPADLRVRRFPKEMTS